MSFLFSFILELFKFILSRIPRRLSDGQKEAHETINEFVSGARKSISNADFFNNLLGTGEREKIDTFYSNIPLFDTTKKKISINNLRKSYIILADAGFGKSTILQRKFIKNRIIKGFSYAVYLNSADLKEYLNDINSICRITESLKTLKVRYLTLYLDGIDELDDLIKLSDNKDKIKQLVQNFKDCCSYKAHFSLCVACRKKYSERNNIPDLLFEQNEIYYKKYAIGDWTTNEHLFSLAKKILNNKEIQAYCSADRNNTRHSRYCALKQNILQNNKKIFTTKFVSNPLLLKLYIYIGLYDDVAGLNDLEKNEFKLLEKFIDVLFTVVSNGDRIGEIEYKNFLTKVFNKFKNGTRLMLSHIDEKMRPYLIPIIKGDNDYVTFVHKRFFEFFVVKVYIDALLENELNKQTIDVLCNYYTNDYADLITSALVCQKNEIKQGIVKRLISLYFCTTKDIAKSDVPENIKDIIIRLDSQKFLYLKHEIIFRLGRLDIEDTETVKKIKVFFKDMYYNDCETKQDKAYSDYFACLIKRWFAVSSSFIGGEEIEINYARNMIKNDGDENNYDFANLYYMMIFYNDVYYSLFSPKDLCNYHEPYDKTKTWNKCLNRLKPFYDDQGDVRDDILTCATDNDDNYRAELKRYYFRVFDLATLYTFKRRGKIVLDDQCANIIKNAKIEFNNMSKERKDFLLEIKSLLLS